ncbi:Sulfite exporter TauE/SafE (plasmid) [Piscirickettsia salmonis]|uniref:sulfite exporter TauE/SafE family protein n=1 Tax=Piscirickettsia salmonis TaxID=1238 RepID=UPI0012B82890|nr:sulfite exporter TauE/SafE family protein [Piscirickettsia salmonis]QGP52159.1 Sulfite exporter TauE/SafE [Piscirickettsia salmonis]
MVLAAYIIAGVFTGILSGWVGAGGGIIIVPVMLWLAAQQGMNAALAMHLAVTTSLGFIMVNSLYTTFHHYRSNNLVVSLFKGIFIFTVIGALIGGQLDKIIPVVFVKVLFTVIIISVLAQSFFNRIDQVRQFDCLPVYPNFLSRSIMGFSVGILASLVGIGGSAITNPYMQYHRYPMKKSAAMSTALAFPMGLFAIASLLASSIGMAGLPSGCIGYLYLPAFIGLLIGSLLGSPLGVWLVKRVSEQTSIWVFRIVLLAVIIQMVR